MNSEPVNAYERSIIHLNVADFAVAVERAVDCRLKDRPVIIAPEGAARAAVYDMSEEAYLNGIRKGMALRRAVRLCKNVRILPPHPDRYEHAMRALLKQTLPYSPLIETGEADEVGPGGAGRVAAPQLLLQNDDVRVQLRQASDDLRVADEAADPAEAAVLVELLPDEGRIDPDHGGDLPRTSIPILRSDPGGVHRHGVEGAAQGQLAAAAVEGVAFKVTRAAVDRAGASTFRYFTGVWPGERRPDEA